MTNALVKTSFGDYLVDLEEEKIIGEANSFEPEPAARVELPRVIDAAATGSTILALLDRRPPLAVSHDAGSTWREAGG